MLGEKLSKHGSAVYLVNTGWVGGPYGTGHRMDLPSTRAIIHAILDDSLAHAEYAKDAIFGLEIPLAVNDVDSNLLNPRQSWADPEAYDLAARKLADMFIPRTFPEKPMASNNPS